MDCQYLDFAKFDSNPAVYSAANRRDLVTNRNTYNKNLNPSIQAQYSNYQGVKGSFYVNDNPAQMQTRGADLSDNVEKQQEKIQCTYKQMGTQQANEKLINQLNKMKRKLEQQQLQQQQQISNQLFVGVFVAILVVIVNIMIINNIKQTLYRKIDKLDNKNSN